MDSKKKSTRELLAESFRELLFSIPFDKITIKMITDRTGVIRPTFYNYFQDKYEVIEYIFRIDIADKVDIMLKNGMETEAFKFLFVCFENNLFLYQRLFEIEGQNSFYDLLFHYLYQTFLEILKNHPLKPDIPLTFLTNDLVARHYALDLTDTIRMWLRNPGKISAQQVYDAYYLLLHNSILDLIDLDI